MPTTAEPTEARKLNVQIDLEVLALINAEAFRLHTSMKEIVNRRLRASYAADLGPETDRRTGSRKAR